jgi:hypothetical protein
VRLRAWMLWLPPLALTPLTGCGEPCAATLPAPGSAQHAEQPAAPERCGRLFDPRRKGDIVGAVRWRGDRPNVPAFHSIAEPLTDQPPPPPRDWPNPNAPAVHPETSGLANTLVWLQRINPEIARPWDLPPVRIVLRDQQFLVVQGQRQGAIGIVRAGAAISMVSQDKVFHSIQGRGLTFFTRNGRPDAFFSCPLPDRDKVVTRRLDFPEIVELSSGCGYFWMRAYLLVSAHPHATVTDAEGNFTLHDVPQGRYRIVAWRPNWRLAATERNPDNMRVQQVRFGPPLEARQSVQVRPGAPAHVELTLGNPP